MLRLRYEFDSRLGRCCGVGQRTYLSRALTANGGRLGGQAGARSTGKKSLGKTRPKDGRARYESPGTTRHQTWPAPPVGIARTSEAILTGMLRHGDLAGL